MSVNLTDPHNESFQIEFENGEVLKYSLESASKFRTDMEDSAVVDVCKSQELFQEHPIDCVKALVTKMIPLKMEKGDVVCHVGDVCAAGT